MTRKPKRQRIVVIMDVDIDTLRKEEAKQDCILGMDYFDQKFKSVNAHTIYVNYDMIDDSKDIIETIKRRSDIIEIVKQRS